METRANYAIVGFFTLLVLAASFGFVYWLTNYGRTGDVAELHIRIPGSANGLSVGSPVRFNGISVGAVRGLSIDQRDPSFVLAQTEVSVDAPVNEATRATLEIQGLTGSAYIELASGDTPGADNILVEALETGVPAQLTAEPSGVTNLLATADQILDRANNVIGQVEGFILDAREPLTNTLRNTETFSQALTDNADGIDQFLQSVASLSETFSGLSGRLDTTFEAAERLLTSVDPAKVDSILSNVDQVTEELAAASGQVTETVASFRETAQTFETFSQTAANSVNKVDTLLDSVDPVKVGQAIDDITAASASARQALDDTSKITSRFGERAEDIDKLITDVSSMATTLNQASTKFGAIMENVDEQNVAQALNGLTTIVNDVTEVLASVDGEKVGQAVDDIASASASAKQAAEDTSQLTASFGERSEDIDQLITDVTQMASRLNAASVRVDGVLAKVDDFLGEGDASALLADAEAAIASFRALADNINARVGPIATNLERFSGSGLRDVESLIVETRRSIGRIERAISSIEDDPQRIIFGGDQVKQFDGRVRR